MTMATDGISGRPRCQIEVPQYHRSDGTAAIDELLDRLSVDGRDHRQPILRARRRNTLAILLAMLQSQHQGNVPMVAPFADWLRRRSP